MDKINVMNESWDYLIILDACRYDYFERIWRKYLQGRLEKRISPGSSTNQWRDESFPDFYDDLVYITANPQISATSKVYGFCAGEHFHTVHEVWKDGWDQDIGTVLPESITRVALDIIRRTPNKRFVVHYLQPHAPYLSLSDKSRGYLNADINAVRRLVGAAAGGKMSRRGGRLLKYLSKAFRGTNILTNQPEWVLRKLLGIPPKAPMESAWRTVGRERLRQAYAENLKAVLKQVAELVEHLSGKIVITSDHGELLGEDRCYAHPTGSDHRILREVPWLVIEKSGDIGSGHKVEGADSNAGGPPTGAEEDAVAQEEQQELSDKLRALGYFD